LTNTFFIVQTFDPVKCPQAIEYQGATPVLVFHPKFVVQTLLNYPANRPRIKASCTKSVSKYKSSLVYTPHKQRGITRIDFGSDSVWCALQNMSGWVYTGRHAVKTLRGYATTSPCSGCCARPERWGFHAG